MVRNGSMVQGEKPRVWVKPWWREVWSRARNRGFGSNPVPPQCGPGRETVGLGQALVAGNVVQGAKPRVWVKPWWREMWSRERNRGFGSNLGGGKCGPGSKIAGLGQTLVAGNVVQGEKLRVWAKPWWREMWSRERNRGFGSNPAPPEYGPGRETAGLGQALPRRSVVQGAKPRPRVKPGLARAWSRERNRGFGSSPAPPQCGPWSKTAAPGQPRPRRSVVQGEKLRPRVKLGPAEVWSRERNRGFWVKPSSARVWSREKNRAPGSNSAPPECGPGRETAPPGQTRPRPSVVQGEKPRVWVKPGPAAVWSRERNRGFGSNPAPPECGPGRKTAGLGQALVAGNVVQGEKPRPWVKPGPAAVWSVEQNRGFGSNPAPPECGPGRETAPPGQALVAGNVVQGEKPRPRVNPGPAAVWSRERNRGPGSNSAPPKHGPGRETAGLGQTRPRRSVVRGVKPRPRVKPGPARVWLREKNRGPGSSSAPPQCGPGRKNAAPGQTQPRRSVVRGAKPRPRVKPSPARVWSVEQNRGPGSTPAQPKHGPRT